jgi:hypothetical protein
MMKNGFPLFFIRKRRREKDQKVAKAVCISQCMRGIVLVDIIRSICRHWPAPHADDQTGRVWLYLCRQKCSQLLLLLLLLQAMMAGIILHVIAWHGPAHVTAG